MAHHLRNFKQSRVKLTVLHCSGGSLSHLQVLSLAFSVVVVQVTALGLHRCSAKQQQPSVVCWVMFCTDWFAAGVDLRSEQQSGWLEALSVRLWRDMHGHINADSSSSMVQRLGIDG